MDATGTMIGMVFVCSLGAVVGSYVRWKDPECAASHRRAHCFTVVGGRRHTRRFLHMAASLSGPAATLVALTYFYDQWQQAFESANDGTCPMHTDM